MSALAVSGLAVQAGGRTLLERVTFTLEGGQFLALLGPNGAGKTTLLRAALGLIRASSGEVRVAGTPVASLSPRARARELGWLPQEPLRADQIPVLDVVTAARYRFDETAKHAQNAAREALDRVGMAAHASRRFSELSGGERQRVAIAALVAQEARVLLLDEPANHLDPAQQAETYALIGALRATGAAVVCVTHDVNLLAHVGDNPRILGLSGGTLCVDSEYAAPGLADELGTLFGVPMRTLEAAGRRFIVPVPRPAREAP